MSTTLVLFDIDGTLLITGGASTRSIRRTAAAVLGHSVENVKITVGTLDPEILTQLARSDVSERLLQTYRQQYAADFREELARSASEVKALPGAIELVDRLSSMPGVCVGILSGNWREIGEIKLTAAGYNLSWFPVKAFADDGECRADLVPAALKQATALGYRCSARDVVLVGDTPRDIACAREAGCRVVSVATGKYSLSALLSHSADVAIPDLAHPEPLFGLIGPTT